MQKYHQISQKSFEYVLEVVNISFPTFNYVQLVYILLMGDFFIEILAVWKCRLGASYMYMYTVCENIHFMRRVINTAMYKMIHFSI